MNLRKYISNISYKYFDRSKKKIGKGCSLHYGGTFITSKIENVALNGIYIGANTYIGRFFNLHTASEISLGKNVVLSDYVYISTIAHGITPGDIRIMEQPWEDKGSVRIGDNSFLGFGVIVLPNVSIGRWCIIGAGSVVTKSFPDYSMVAGNPAKLIKRYCLEKKEWI
ncbi:hypothetical protein PS1M3_04160 [Pseudoalteromonas sp. PS1M3]|uniref:acyltransferase n=1 Tax=Pseudoalteromonas sp. PS1M3 TaxID=87791 RepID=UPI0019523874|nr:acyltransferase [Pseudoalteromonas sp. PS1M3]BBW90329.1 hypothetical protein PS1M3_04160 [Pseudoalteromonas sp. PS1M3]